MPKEIRNFGTVDIDGSDLGAGSVTEAQLASDSVTADKIADEAVGGEELDSGAMRLLTFDGFTSPGAGACSCLGAKVGDKVIGVADLTTNLGGQVKVDFESTITVNDQIQQLPSAGDYSAKKFVLLLVAKS